MSPIFNLEEPQVVRAKGMVEARRTSKLLMKTCICRMPWHDPELEVGHRNMLSALLTTPLVHCKHQSLGSHKAKIQEAKLKTCQLGYQVVRYTAKLKPI